MDAHLDQIRESTENAPLRATKMSNLGQTIIMCLGWIFVANANDFSTPDFNKDIAPLIAKRCLECHNERDVKGDVNLTTHEGFAVGTDEGRLLLSVITFQFQIFPK